MSDSSAADAVAFALKNGYPMIDSAAIYHNEHGVGQGIKDSGVERERIWVTSKVSFVTPCFGIRLRKGLEYDVTA